MSGTGGGPPAGGASSGRERLELSDQEAAEYIASILEGLMRVGSSARMPFLAYLINIALEEARLEKAPRD